MKTIIAPTDFSLVSLNAVNYAADMATALNAELVVVHVSGSAFEVSDVPDLMPMNFDDVWEVEHLNNFRNKLLERTKNKIKIRTENLKGSVLLALREFCELEKPFVVVMATHGSPAFERILFQSVTLYATKHIKYPVLIVPENAIYTHIKNIALACDLKNIYEEPLEVLRDLIVVFHSSLHVLHVKQPGEDQHFAEMMLTRHHLHEFKPEIHFIESDNIEEGAFSFAKNNAMDLLIIIPKRHTLFDKSELRKFVLHPQVPIMTLQPEL